MKAYNIPTVKPGLFNLPETRRLMQHPDTLPPYHPPEQVLELKPDAKDSDTSLARQAFRGCFTGPDKRRYLLVTDLHPSPGLFALFSELVDVETGRLAGIFDWEIGPDENLLRLGFFHLISEQGRGLGTYLARELGRLLPPGARVQVEVSEKITARAMEEILEEMLRAGRITRRPDGLPDFNRAADQVSAAFQPLYQSLQSPLFSMLRAMELCLISAQGYIHEHSPAFRLDLLKNTPSGVDAEPE